MCMWCVEVRVEVCMEVCDVCVVCGDVCGVWRCDAFSIAHGVDPAYDSQISGHSRNQET